MRWLEGVFRRALSPGRREDLDRERGDAAWDEFVERNIDETRRVIEEFEASLSRRRPRSR